MKKQKVVPNVVTIILSVLLIDVIVANIAAIGQVPNLVKAIKILDCVACAFALFYCVNGYKKDAHEYFKAFCAVYCLSYAMPIFSFATMHESFYLMATAIHIVSVFCLSPFVIADNLGKKKSYTLSAIVLTGSVIHLISSYADTFVYQLGVIAKSILAVVFFIMVYAKYQDKDARGTV